MDKKRLTNGGFTARLDAHGLIAQLSFRNTGLPVADETVFVETDEGTFDLASLDCRISSSGENTATATYACKGISFLLEYDVLPGENFVRRKLTVLPDHKITLLRVGDRLKIPADCEVFLYKTFVNASAAVFLRADNRGLYTGFENPYFTLDRSQGAATVSFEPSVYVGAGEAFMSDINFFGVYALCGDQVAPDIPRTTIRYDGRNHTRYRNPSEGIALDRAEIDAFQRYTFCYFGIAEKQFRLISYNFFSNLPQRPETDEEERKYRHHIDVFCAMGGDTIILNPLCANKIPNQEPSSDWELAPEGSRAQRIMEYARAKGLRIGMYTGTAGNGLYGNSSMIPFASSKERPAWKKIDLRGKISEENCIADDDFADWYIKVQANTIEKYHLSLWDWDPGPGNGMFCHSDAHGHIPGKGAYKGFRNSLKIMAALKKKFPGLYYQGFHGNKEYGLWGFKYIDQHEAYWENDPFWMTPVYPDLSADRVTANGIRFQSYWNYCFRFMPCALNHGLSHRMVQNCGMGMTDGDELFDHLGWKYALLSAIAAGGDVTMPILPAEPDRVYGGDYTAFYKKMDGLGEGAFRLLQAHLPLRRAGLLRRRRRFFQNHRQPRLCFSRKSGAHDVPRALCA